MKVKHIVRLFFWQANLTSSSDLRESSRPNDEDSGMVASI
jgi:hypothetical protein